MSQTLARISPMSTNVRFMPNLSGFATTALVSLRFSHVKSRQCTYKYQCTRHRPPEELQTCAGRALTANFFLACYLFYMLCVRDV
eukprot:g48787.t1